MKGLAIVPNWQKVNVRETVWEIITFLRQEKVSFYLDQEGAAELGLPEHYAPVSDWSQGVDLVLVLGGDGTILRVARSLVGSGLPIMGINLGDMGFLTAMEITELSKGLQQVLAGEYEVQDRMMLSAKVVRDGQEMASYEALNDIVISKGPFSRIIELFTYINNDFLEKFPGDGVIISTPTGSTGYSLSAGGPIVNPDLHVIIITPICPHLLHHRSVIVHEEDEIRMKVMTRHAEVVLTVDGQLGFTLQNEDEVMVKRSKHKTKLVNFKDKTFYNLLHYKLKKTTY
jgi:NAD+ kinase